MSSMPAAMRHRQIASCIETGEALRVSQLAERFGVTTETVRRDLKRLERDGSVRRVFGGAVPIYDGSEPLHERETNEAAGKRAIARLVAPLIQAERTIYISSGSTALAVARKLAAGPRLVVTTHMPKIAEVMGAPGRHSVTLLGGAYNYAHGVVMDMSVVAAVDDRNFDVAIIGFDGVDPHFGATDNAEYNFHLKRKLKQRSGRCLFLATRGKFGRRSTFRTLPFRDLSTLVTDQVPPPEFLDPLEEAAVAMLWPEKAET